MKEYIIVRYRNPRVFGITRLTRQAVGMAYGQEYSDSINPEQLENDIYFADTMDDATQLCHMLCNQQPGATFLVGKTTDVFHQPVTTPIHSKLTEKGLLPT